MNIVEAGPADIGDICAVLLDCRLDLEARSLLQWDAHYPSRSFVSDAVARKTQFVFFDGGRIDGVVVLDEVQVPEWRTVTWGVQAPPFLVVHTLAIAPRCQGRGYGGRLLRFGETMASEHGYSSIRLDVSSENVEALRFYERQGYVLCGQVRFAFKPIGHQVYFCYEKPLTGIES